MTLVDVLARPLNPLPTFPRELLFAEFSRYTAVVVARDTFNVILLQEVNTTSRGSMEPYDVAKTKNSLDPILLLNEIKDKREGGCVCMYVGDERELHSSAIHERVILRITFRPFFTQNCIAEYKEGTGSFQSHSW